MTPTSITCPTCGYLSHHPHDILDWYCRRCREFHELMAPREPGEPPNPATKPLPLIRGDFVHATFAGATLPAMVVLASGNHESLMLMFDGKLGGYVGMMPVLWHDEVAMTGKGCYRELLVKAEVTLELMRRA